MSVLDNYSCSIEDEFKNKFGYLYNNYEDRANNNSIQDLKLLFEFAEKKTDKIDKYEELLRIFRKAKTIEDKEKAIELFKKLNPFNIGNHFIREIKTETDKVKPYQRKYVFYDIIFQYDLTEEAKNSYSAFASLFDKIETTDQISLILRNTYKWITKVSRLRYFPKTEEAVIEVLDLYLVSDLRKIILAYT